MDAEERLVKKLAILWLFFAALWAGCSSVPEKQRPDEPADQTSREESQEKVSELVFEGNQKISEGAIRDELEGELERLHERGFRKADVDDIAYEVELLYRNRGYHFARVDYEYSSERSVLRITEGDQVLIQTVRFSGNTVISREKLLELLTAARAGFLGLGSRVFVAEEVASLRSAVEDVYFERGYQEVRVLEPTTEFTADKKYAIVQIDIEEGPQYILEAIDFSDVPSPLKRDELVTRFRYLVGSAYIPRLRFEVRSGVEETLADRGYPAASASISLSVEDRAEEERRVSVTFTVRAQTGPLVRVRQVIVHGAKSTSEAFIKSRVLLEEGGQYNGTLVRRSYRRLFGTGLFKTVELRLSDSPDETPGEEPQERDLIVEVTEGPSLEYFFELGFGSYDLARAKAGVREKNLFGRGLIGRAEVLGSIRGGQATLGITDPWFLWSEWTADLPITALYREEPSFTVREATARLRVSRPIFERLVGGAAYRFSLSEIEEFQIEETDDEEPDLRLAALGPFLEYDSRDDIFAPTRGVRARAFGEVGAPQVGGEISFIHAGFSTSQYLGIFDGTVLAGTLQTEWIFPFDDTELIPIQERLFNGGENSVRSFEEAQLGPKDDNGEPLGGEVRNLVSLELRQRVIGLLWLAVFGDYGNVALKRSRPFQDFRSAVGGGLRYNLPVGALRLDVGFNPDQRDDEDLFEIHFAVGMAY